MGSCCAVSTSLRLTPQASAKRISKILFSGNVRDPLTSGVTDKLANPGSILVFKYANPVTN